MPFVFAGSFAQAQKLKKEDKQLIANLQQHVQYLADDKLEGRRTGTQGEKLAAEYISAEFNKIGLQPKGSNGFFQAFDVKEGKQVNPSTHLIIDGNNLLLNKEFFPFAYSANASVEALPSLALQEPNMPWFYDVKELLDTVAANPHFDLNEALIDKAKEARKKGLLKIVYTVSYVRDFIKKPLPKEWLHEQTSN